MTAIVKIREAGPGTKYLIINIQVKSTSPSSYILVRRGMTKTYTSEASNMAIRKGSTSLVVFTWGTPAKISAKTPPKIYQAE